MDGPFDSGCFDIGIRQRPSLFELFLQRFMQINHHDHAGLYRDSEERDVADRDRDAEVVFEQPGELVRRNSRPQESANSEQCGLHGAGAE